MDRADSRPARAERRGAEGADRGRARSGGRSSSTATPTASSGSCRSRTGATSSGSGAATRPTSASTGTARSRACTRSSSSSARECTLVDDGLSRNGSFVNGERVSGRRRLRDGDMMRFGRTVMLYRAPADRERERPWSPATRSPRPASRRPAAGAGRALPAVQGRRLVRDPGDQRPDRRGARTSASTRSRPTCGRCSRSSASRTLPQNQKRVALVERALQSGLVTEREL